MQLIAVNCTRLQLIAFHCSPFHTNAVNCIQLQSIAGYWQKRRGFVRYSFGICSGVARGCWGADYSFLNTCFPGMRTLAKHLQTRLKATLDTAQNTSHKKSNQPAVRLEKTPHYLKPTHF